MSSEHPTDVTARLGKLNNRRRATGPREDMKAAALLLLALALQTRASPIRQPAEILPIGDIEKDVEVRGFESGERQPKSGR